MSEEKWIADVLNSMQNAGKAKAPVGVFDDIAQQIEQQSNQKPKHQWLAVAAIILLVLCSNALLVENYWQEEELVDYQDDYPELISDYTLYDNE